MGKAILLTGSPGSGKTTAIQKVLSYLHRQASGFTTQELREGGRRKGFNIRTLNGTEGVLAHVDLRGVPRIGKYGVNLEAIDTLGLNSLRHALETGALAVVDEIGPMEILSERFREVLMALLEADVDILGTIVKRSLPFTDRIKGLPNVSIVEIHPGNRDRVVGELVQMLEN